MTKNDNDVIVNIAQKNRRHKRLQKVIGGGLWAFPCTSFACVTLLV